MRENLNQRPGNEVLTQPPEQPTIDISAIIPTLVPQLLREASVEATRLAGDRFNYLDNNPFIKHEWLIVSQILHNAAATMENRFAVLFQRR
jgi:hypothetical protein